MSQLILGIETSCDDTACAVVDDRGRVLASVVSSQLHAHRPYGGVVPEVASREHLKNWPTVSAETLAQAGVELADLDAVAATRGPGLIGSLLVGLSLGRALAFGLGRPFYGMHHLEGHLYSPFLASGAAAAANVPTSFVGLVVSGGHASLLTVERGAVASVAETRDDAMGEVFDKVGKRLGLSYPQGPRVDALAEHGDPSRFPFAVPGKGSDELFFSFSGLKSQALRAIDSLESQGIVTARSDLDETSPFPQEALDLLAGFRQAAVRQIIDRLERFAAALPLLAVSGGAAANRLLRRELSLWAEARDVDLRLVPLEYSGDNAAMIAFAALLRLQSGAARDDRDLEVASRLPFAPARR